MTFTVQLGKINGKTFKWGKIREKYNTRGILYYKRAYIQDVTGKGGAYSIGPAQTNGELEHKQIRVGLPIRTPKTWNKLGATNAAITH